jgi:uncharacterized protein YndB with AHSA1/START domain
MKRAGFDVCALLLLCGAIAALGCDRSSREPGAAASSAGGHPGIDTSLFVGKGMLTDLVKRETTIKAPVREVFERLTTVDGLTKALSRSCNVDLRIGGPYELFLEEQSAVGDQGSEGAQILSYIPNRMLSFSWNAPMRFPEERKKRTWVVITLDPVGDSATFVSLTHLGFGEGPRWAEVRSYFEMAWGGFLKLVADSFGGAIPTRLPTSAPAPR